MILAFKLGNIITVPFGYLLSWLYQLVDNYGVALILFAVIVKLILLPVTAKSKKSSMKMSRLTPRMNAIREKYADDPQKQNAAVQALYKEEGVSMMGGCLWGFVPLLILIPLYNVVCDPIQYMLHEAPEVADRIVEIVKAATEETGMNLFTSKNERYWQMIAAPHIKTYAAAIQAEFPEISAATLEGIKFNFFKIDLAAIPTFNPAKWPAYNWPIIGAFLVPILSAGSQVLSMFISMRQNNSVITDQNGVQDKETAKNSQTNQTSKTMMWMMPLMSLWIGFSVPAVMSLYWFVQGVVSLLMDMALTKHYRKIYDAEDAVRLQKALEADRLEAEKERVRAERRAANPEGITENTSKKKLQQAKKAEQEAAKAAAAKEYAAKKGIVEETVEKKVRSGITDRPNCKGRAYDPNRYNSESTEE